MSNTILDFFIGTYDSLGITGGTLPPLIVIGATENSANHTDNSMKRLRIKWYQRRFLTSEQVKADDGRGLIYVDFNYRTS